MRTILYIIKRIIIGVTIVLILNFLKSLPVLALESNLIAINTNNQFLLTYNANQPTNDGGNRTFSSKYVTYYSSNWSNCGQTFSAYEIDSSHPTINFNNNTYFGFSLPLSTLRNNYNYDIIIYGYYLPSNVEFEGMYRLTRVQNYPYNSSKLNSTGSYYTTSTDFSACLKTQTYKVNFDYTNSTPYAYIQYKTTTAYTSTSPLFFGYEIVEKGPSTNLNDINNSLNNDSVDDPSSSFESFNNSLPSNNTISNLITLPVKLFQKILNSLSSTCSPFNLGNLMGTDIILPCINISNYIGTTLWSVIDILFSGFFVLVIARKMIKAFENFSSMKEGDVLNG